MQQVLNDFCDDDAKIDFKKFKVNELICVFLDEENLTVRENHLQNLCR